MAGLVKLNRCLYLEVPTMTEAETQALELVSELSTIDASIADTRKKIATLREKQTALADDTTTLPAKLAAQIKKCADDIEVAESTIEIIDCLLYTSDAADE